MRLHILSDLHLDTWGMDPPLGLEADVSAILGDSHEGIKALGFIEAIAQERPTIVLLGNHEFYGSSLASIRAEWRAIAAKNENIIFLDNDVWIHKGVRFIGATLWTDFLNGNPTMMLQGQSVVKDYMYIDNDEGDERISTDFILAEHRKSRDFIEQELSNAYDGLTVVLTHHSPSYMSVAKMYQGHPHNHMFCSNLDELFHYYDFAFWGHGHMHNSADYLLEGKRVINNPRGSRSYPNHEFDPRRIIEIK